MYFFCIGNTDEMRSYLHHEKERVEDDEGHDEIFERSRDDHSPNLVLEALSVFWHVAFKRFGLDGEIDARFL